MFFHLKQRVRQFLDVLKPRKQLLMLSHMRAYTSLTGHILGSHPEIDGYYELHKGYFSWKSLWHAKLLYFKEHSAKPGGKFLFDKVLHNEHYVVPSVLTNNRVTVLISIRSPMETIPSILEHYQKVNPTHQYCDIDNAINYYEQRLIEIAKLSESIQNNYFYFDAELLKTSPQGVCDHLSKHLNLKLKLTPSYKKMRKTGARFSGDNSSELMSGEVQVKSKIRKPLSEESAQKIQKCNHVYNKIRQQLISGALKSLEKGPSQ